MSTHTHTLHLFFHSLHPQAAIATLTARLPTSMGLNPQTHPAACVSDNPPISGMRQQHFSGVLVEVNTFRQHLLTRSPCVTDTCAAWVREAPKSQRPQQLIIQVFNRSPSPATKMLGLLMQIFLQLHTLHSSARPQHVGMTRAIQKLNEVQVMSHTWTGVNFRVRHSITLCKKTDHHTGSRTSQERHSQFKSS